MVLRARGKSCAIRSPPKRSTDTNARTRDRSGGLQIQCDGLWQTKMPGVPGYAIIPWTRSTLWLPWMTSGSNSKSSSSIGNSYTLATEHFSTRAEVVSKNNDLMTAARQSVRQLHCYNLGPAAAF